MLIKTANKVHESVERTLVGKIGNIGEKLENMRAEDHFLTKHIPEDESIPKDDILNCHIPVTKTNSREKELERELLQNIPRTHSISKDKELPAYAKFKIYQREIYG